ncbi:MAG: hypothetical protein EBU85_07595, partial [Actinobacteria bacterium]|nr:hypothetical protein [Actinomycetota bacterium]
SKEFKQTEQVREWFPEDPASLVTLGAEFSSGLNSIYLNSNTGIWASQSRETFVFLNSRNTWSDNHQTIGSLGLAVRQLFPEHNVIIGLNGYWDSLHGQGGSEFNQLGVGAEILTQWVDARFNAYLPEETQTQIRKHTWQSYDDRGVPHAEPRVNNDVRSTNYVERGEQTFENNRKYENNIPRVYDDQNQQTFRITRNDRVHPRRAVEPGLYIAKGIGPMQY